MARLTPVLAVEVGRLGGRVNAAEVQAVTPTPLAAPILDDERQRATALAANCR